MLIAWCNIKYYKFKRISKCKSCFRNNFCFLNKKYERILVIAGAIVGLKLAASLVAIVKVGAGILAILANPLLLAGIGVLWPLVCRDWVNEKEVLKELQDMGGYSKENRDALISKI